MIKRGRNFFVKQFITFTASHISSQILFPGLPEKPKCQIVYILLVPNKVETAMEAFPLLTIYLFS